LVEAKRRGAINALICCQRPPRAAKLDHTVFLNTRTAPGLRVGKGQPDTRTSAVAAREWTASPRVGTALHRTNTPRSRTIAAKTRAGGAGAIETHRASGIDFYSRAPFLASAGRPHSQALSALCRSAFRHQRGWG
jgi:hypothetical protein